MKKFILSIVFLFVISFSFSQTNRFQKLIAELSGYGTYVNDVLIGEPNKYFVLSNRSVVCIDSMGVTQWTYDNPRTNGFQHQMYIGDNKVVLFYSKDSTINWLAVTSIEASCIQNGVELWHKSFKTDPLATEGIDLLTKDSQNNIIITNYSINNSEYSQYVIKLSATDGSILSTNKIPLTPGLFVRSMLIDKSDNVYLFMSNTSNTQSSMFVLNTLGNFSLPIVLDVTAGIYSSCILDNEQIALLIFNQSESKNYHCLIDKNGNVITTVELPSASIKFISALPGNNILYTGEVYYPGLVKYEAAFYYTNTSGEVSNVVRYPAIVNGLLRPNITEHGEIVFVLVFNINSYDNNSYLFKTDINGYVYDDGDFTEIVYTDPNFDCFVDADRDGDYDALVRKDIFLNDGTGNFGNTQANSYSEGFYGPLSWEDIDNDFDQDLYNSRGYMFDNFLFNDNKILKQDSIMNHPAIYKSVLASWMDTNDDGYSDLLLYQNNSANLYLSNGNNKFDVLNGQQFSFNEPVYTHRWIDVDNDSDMDLFILLGEYGANKAFFFRNDGKGLFTDQTSFYDFLTGPFNGDLFLDFIDLDNNQTIDLLLGKNYTTSLYSNDGHGNFTFKKDLGALGSILKFVDYDNDGDIDILSGNIISTVIYRNDGYLRFSNNLSVAGAITDILDYNNDGNLDLIYKTGGYQGLMYKNAGNNNHWINILLKGNISTGSGLGAIVKVKAAINPFEKIWQTQYVTSGNPLHFGLGRASVIDSITIVWPSGCIENYKMVPTNTLMTYSESCSGVNPKSIDTSICSNTFSYDQQPAGSSFKWYTSLTATTPFSSSNTVEITNIDKDTLVFVANTDGQMEGRRMPVFIRKKTVPVSDFTYISDLVSSAYYQVQFTSKSTGYDSLRWYFGDSKIYSNTINPNGYFSEDKNGMPVHLVSYSFCGKDSITKILNLNNAPLSIVMINNPLKSSSSLNFTMNETQAVKIVLYSYTGQVVGEILNETLSPGSYNIQIPDVLQNQMLPGVYLISLNRGNNVETLRIIK